MLRFNRITKYFGGQLIFSELNLLIDANTRIAIVGPNGCGKSTLLRIAHGDLEPDDGTVIRARDCVVSMLPQLVKVSAADLSGGERQRMALETILSDHASVLLLDEPTNNLDEQSIGWLEQRLLAFRGALVVVSHDRTFLDHVATSILEIDPVTGRCTDYAGINSFYELKKAQDLERQTRLYASGKRKVHQLELDIRATKDKALAVENRTVHDFYRRKSKKVARTAKVREYRLNKLLDAEANTERPRSPEQLRLELAPCSLTDTCLLELRDLSFQPPNDDGPADSGQEMNQQCSILKDINLSVHAGERIVVTGANGSGKTTLLRLMLGELQPTQGTIFRHSKMSITYLPQNMRLPDNEHVLEWFESQLTDGSNCRLSHADMRSFLHRFLFSGDDVFKRISQLSCGEMTRLQLAAIMVSAPNLLVLDEPTNHMDADVMKSIERALQRYSGAFVLVSHDRRFRTSLRPSLLWQVEQGRVTACPCRATDDNGPTPPQFHH